MALLAQWQQRKKNAGTPSRLAMLLLEVMLLSFTMFIVAASMHHVVQSLDSIYEILGRRARSPFTTSTPWTSIAVAAILLAGWHVYLGRLSYSAVMEESREKGSEGQTRVSWGRVLGRIVIPLLLLSFGVHFAYQVLDRLARPAPFVTPNINDAKEIESELRNGY